MPPLHPRVSPALVHTVSRGMEECAHIPPAAQGPQQSLGCPGLGHPSDTQAEGGDIGQLGNLRTSNNIKSSLSQAIKKYLEILN